MTESRGGVGILGVGSSLPDKVLTNADLEKMVDTSNEWIVQRTGMSERRILEKGEPIFEYGAQAAQNALKYSGISAEDIDLIIVATATPDYMSPSMACLIQNRIGAVKAAAFDMNAACAGFLYALITARQFMFSGQSKYVLVIGCDGLSKIVDWEDRNTCILFGDGAGAVVLGPVEAGHGILATHFGSDGSSSDVITIPNVYLSEEDQKHRLHENKRVLWMDGSAVMKFAVRVMTHATEQVLEDSGLTIDDIRLLIPHQANIRIIDGAAKRLGIPAERVFTNIQKYGNISAASIPVALDEAVRQGNLSKGDNFIMVGFGAGLTWASVALKWAI